MCFDPIQSGDDYDAALAEIATLMDADCETPEGRRLDALTALVEAYELRHWPVGSPGRNLDRSGVTDRHKDS